MKKFFIKLVLFVSIFLILNIVIIALPDDNNDFLHAILDKHALLKSTEGEKRLIIVGGSNVAFGVDSQKIQEELGVKVDDVGVHAGIGLKYTLDDLDRYIEKGDTVLLIPEYQMFYDDKFYGGTETIEALRMNPENIGKINIKQMGQMLMGYPLYVRTKVGFTTLSLLGVKKFGDIYFRNSFNAFGDLVAHIGRKNVPFDTTCELDNMNKEVFSYIDKVNIRYKDRGAKLLLSFPPIDKIAYRSASPQINIIEKILKKDDSIKEISKLQDYVFNHSLFYNSIYHLDGEGREMRTERLIKDLKKAGCF